VVGWFLVGIPLLAIIVLSWWGEDSRPGFGSGRVDVKERGFVHLPEDRRRI
jgi:hypothetical protein